MAEKRLGYSSYLKGIFTHPAEYAQIISRVVATLSHKADKFDSIAFRGFSGAMVAGPVAHILGKRLILIRKAHEETQTTDSHGNPVEGDRDFNYERIIILDDFISGGGTIKAILSKLAEYGLKDKVVAIFLWSDQYFTSKTKHDTYDIWR